ncbi:MAG: hypothetical protein O7H41_20905 [Planctomycetota bacterium]|nr:hypothetical protein [Planctomycetota bacterium]
MMDGPSSRHLVGTALAEYSSLRRQASEEPSVRSSQRTRLIGLLELIHLYRPPSLEAVESSADVTLADLRRDYEELDGADGAH